MRKKTLRNFLSFLLVLVCTVTAVAALHLVTRAQAPSLPAVEEALPAAQLSASVPPQLVASPLVCVGAFLGMLAIVAIGLAVYRREKRCGKRARQGRRSYIPRRTWRSPAETEYKGFRPFIFYLGTGPATSAGPVFAQNKSRRGSSTAACFLCFMGGKSGRPAAPHSPGWARCRPPPPRGSVTWPARPPPRCPPAGR